MRAPRAEGNEVFRFRNRRQIEVRPATLLQKVADQSVKMQMRHDDDDGILGLGVETGEQRVGGSRAR